MSSLWVNPAHQDVFRRLGLDIQTIFEHPAVNVWRSLPDRQNATLDATGAAGAPVRFHVKRYAATRGRISAAEAEVRGHRLLIDHAIPTAALVAWGGHDDGRSVVVFEDLANFRPADKLIEAGTPFALLLAPAARLASLLHQAGLHHRDLYLCHFLARMEGDRLADLRLIDPARVRRLPCWPLRRRWIVKDLAQFWYSTMDLPITEGQRMQWLDCYARGVGVRAVGLKPAIERKARRIARHDARLRRTQPTRNVSIPAGR